MRTTEQVVDDLIERFPEDTDDLRDALVVLKQQKLNSYDRLAKLTDSQWQRLGLPLGIESLLRDEAVTCPVETEICNNTSQEGLRQRGGNVKRCQEVEQQQLQPQGITPCTRAQPQTQQNALFGHIDLEPPPDLEFLWQQLLEDTMPPDKRAALQDTWETVHDNHDKYMMFLEYSSYLRKTEITEEEKIQRKKELEPFMEQFGLKHEEDESGLQGAIVWWLLIGIILFMAAIVYYAYLRPDYAHDVQAL